MFSANLFGEYLYPTLFSEKIQVGAAVEVDFPFGDELGVHTTVSTHIHYLFDLFGLLDERNIFIDLSSGIGIGTHFIGSRRFITSPVVYFGATLNIKISKKLYIEIPPLLILPPISRVVFFNNFQNYSGYQYTLFPIGLRFRF